MRRYAILTMVLATILIGTIAHAASIKASLSLAAAIESNEWLWMPNFKGGYAPELTVEYDKEHIDVLMWNADGSIGVVKYKGVEFRLVREADGYSAKSNVEILAERIMKKKDRYKKEEPPKPKSVGDFVASYPLPRHLEFLVSDREMYGNKGKKFWRYRPDASDVVISIIAERANESVTRKAGK